MRKHPPTSRYGELAEKPKGTSKVNHGRLSLVLKAKEVGIGQQRSRKREQLNE